MMVCVKPIPTDARPNQDRQGTTILRSPAAQAQFVLLISRADLARGRL
jgi:hypothetical protein